MPMKPIRNAFAALIVLTWALLFVVFILQVMAVEHLVPFPLIDLTLACRWLAFVALSTTVLGVTVVMTGYALKLILE